jgi:alpha-glucosidase
LLRRQSDVHPWFVESASSRTSSKRDWYVWVDADDDGGNGTSASTSAGPPGPPPNNWKSFFGGSAWTWDTNTRAWYLHQVRARENAVHCFLSCDATRKCQLQVCC